MTQPGFARASERAVLLAGAALFLIPSTAFLLAPVGWAPKLAAAALLVLSAIRPDAGLLILAAVGPIATSLFTEIRTGTQFIRFGEAMTVAFLCGWCIHRALERTPARIPSAIAWCAAALGVAAIGSAAVTLAAACAEAATTPTRDVLVRVLFREYPYSAHPITAAFLLLESVTLFGAAAALCADARERARALAMLVAGAAGAALVDLMRLATAALRTGRGWDAFLSIFVTKRVSVNIVDVNAAGSYFALMLFAALAVRRRRPLVAISVPLIATALWTSGSRVALATALLCAAGLGVAAVWRRLPRRAAVAATIAILAVAAAVSLGVSRVYPHARNMNAKGAFGWRTQMARAAILVTAEHPVFGVGLGNFYEASGKYAEARENAHNNYLQVLAELGAVGLALFLVLLGVVLLSPKDPQQRQRGLSVGLAAFLMTCVAGHPLIVGGAAYPFWMALGVSASTIVRIRGAVAIRRVAMALLVLVLLWLSERVATAVRTADRTSATAGFAEHWQREPDGMRYRWAGGQSVFFVDPSARVVDIPLHAASAASRAEVRVLLDGREADRILLEEGMGWRRARLVLPGDSRYHRVDLEVRRPGESALVTIEPSDGGGALMVGRPEIVR